MLVVEGTLTRSALWFWRLEGVRGVVVVGEIRMGEGEGAPGERAKDRRVGGSARVSASEEDLSTACPKDSSDPRRDEAGDCGGVSTIELLRATYFAEGEAWTSKLDDDVNEISSSLSPSSPNPSFSADRGARVSPRRKSQPLSLSGDSDPDRSQADAPTPEDAT